MTPHAVGHDVEAMLSEDREIILVVRALAAHVRLARYFDAQGS